MTRAAPVVALVAAALVLASPAAAVTWTVGVDAPDLPATVALALDGDVVLVPAGEWAGPATLARSVTLRGTGGVIVGPERGTALRVEAPGTVIEALEVRGRGDDLTGPDASIWMGPGATDSVVRDCVVRARGFGIWIHQTVGVVIEDNRIYGAPEGHRSLRGNGVQLFDASRLTLRGNHLSDGRDGIYVSATEESVIERNLLEGTRYGVHYMYSYDNFVRYNVARGNGSGYALMGSHRITTVENEATDNTQHGILFRDVQYSHIARNRVERNGQGLFFYSSTENTIEDNLIRHNEIGAKIWAGSLRNRVRGNRFVGNRRQIFYVSSSDLVWGRDDPGNLWSDYLGWDQDGDGFGDRPYRVDSFSAHLIHKYPVSALLMRSPALEMLGHLQERMPVLRVSTVIDERPQVRRWAR